VDLSALSAGQLDVFGHDGDSHGVDGAQVTVLDLDLDLSYWLMAVLSASAFKLSVFTGNSYTKAKLEHRLDQLYICASYPIIVQKIK